MVRIKCPMIRVFYCWHKNRKQVQNNRNRKHIKENEQKKVDIEKAKST